MTLYVCKCLWSPRRSSCCPFSPVRKWHFSTHFGHAAQTAGGYNLVVRTGKLRLRRLLVKLVNRHGVAPVGGLVPGVNRQPLKKQKPDPDSLLALLARWRDEAIKAGRTINRVVVAFEAGYDGFWLARWLRAPGIEVSIPCERDFIVGHELFGAPFPLPP